MLTDAKRKKLLAGVLAAVMLTGVAGCGSDKDSEWKNDNAEQEKRMMRVAAAFSTASFPGSLSGAPSVWGLRQACITPSASRRRRPRSSKRRSREQLSRMPLKAQQARACSRAVRQERKSLLSAAQAQAARAVLAAA